MRDLRRARDDAPDRARLHERARRCSTSPASRSSPATAPPADPVVVGGGPCAFNPEPVADFFDAFAVGDGEDVVHEIADAVLAWKGERRGPGRAAPAARPRARRLRPVALRARASTRPRGALLAMDAARARLRAGGPARRARHRHPLHLGLRAPRRPLHADGARPAAHRAAARLHAGLPLLPGGHDHPPHPAAQPGDGAAGGRAGAAGPPATRRWGCSRSPPATTPRLNPLLDDFLSRYESERVSLSLPVAAHRDHERRAGREDRPRPQDRLHAGARGGHRAHARGHQQGQPRGGPARRRRVDLQERLVAPQALLHDRAARGAGRGRGGHRQAGQALPLARRAGRCRPGKGSVAINLGASTFVPKPFTPVPVGADDHAGGDPAAAGARHRRAGRHERSHLRSSRTTPARRPSRGRWRWATGASARRCSTPSGSGSGSTAGRSGSTRGSGSRPSPRWSGSTAWGSPGSSTGAAAWTRSSPGTGSTAAWRRPISRSSWRRRGTWPRSPTACSRPAASAAPATTTLVKNRIYLPEDYVKAPPPPPPPRETPVRTHVRVRYAKEGRLVALSHLEVMHAVLRSVRRAGLPVAFSQGYHPKPRISFGPALPVGVSSTAEFLDLELVGTPRAGRRGPGARPPPCPEGLTFLDAREIDARAPSLSESVRAVHYRVEFPQGWSAEALSRRIEDFHSADRSVVRRAAPPKAREKKRSQRSAAPKSKGDRFEGDGDPPVGRWTRAGRVQLEGGSIGKRQASRGAGGRVRRRSATQRSQGLEGRRQLCAGGG